MLRFASSCLPDETEYCDMTLHGKEHLKLMTLKAYQHIYGRGNKLETGQNISWYLIIILTVREKPSLTACLALCMQPRVEI